MSRFQVLAIVICFLINMLDGFDVLVMAFTADRISNEWALSGKFIGLLFSFGLVGMAIGAIFLGRLADKYGRRALIIICLSIVTLGMLLSSLTNGFDSFPVLARPHHAWCHWRGQCWFDTFRGINDHRANYLG